MSQLFSIMLETNPIQTDMDAISLGLEEYNRQFAEDDDHGALVVVVRDEEKVVVGGLLADTFWRWVHINTLWVRGDLRKMGFGSQLLSAAEQEAVRRGCLHAQLETHQFQALGFYQKHGYTIFAELDHFPPGFKKYFLKKDLV
jgi:GNAT superfamily N-acetyltransferase